MQGLSYRFNYDNREDTIKFSLAIGLQVISLTLKTDDFFGFCDSVAISSAPLFEKIKRRKAEGIEGDVEFDTGAWDKLMSKSEE